MKSISSKIVTIFVVVFIIFFSAKYIISIKIVPSLGDFFINHNRSVTASSTLPIVQIKAPLGIIKAFVVSTKQDLVRGLSGRTSMKNNEGMFFVFTEPAMHIFWMKDMFFPIDIVWIDANMTVVSVTENISPDTYPETFEPESPTLYVLELNAGKAKEYGLVKGKNISVQK